MTVYIHMTTTKAGSKFAMWTLISSSSNCIQLEYLKNVVKIEIKNYKSIYNFISYFTQTKEILG